MSKWNDNTATATDDWSTDSAFAATDEAAVTDDASVGADDSTAEAAEEAQQADAEDNTDSTADTAAEKPEDGAEAEEGNADDSTDEDSQEEDEIEVDEDEVEGDEDEWVISDDLIQNVARFTTRFLAADKAKRDFLREIIRPRRGARAKNKTRLGVSEIASALTFEEKQVETSTLFLLDSLSKALNPETQNFTTGMEAIEIISDTEPEYLRDLIAFVNDAVLSGDLVAVSDVTEEDKVERLRTGKTSTPAAQIIDSLSKAIQKVEDTEAFFALVSWSSNLVAGLIEE